MFSDGRWCLFACFFLLASAIVSGQSSSTPADRSKAAANPRLVVPNVFDPQLHRELPEIDEVALRAEKSERAVLVVAVRKSSNPQNTLELDFDGERIILNDEGRAPDEKAGDLVFSGYVKSDIRSLEKQAKSLNNEEVLRVTTRRRGKVIVASNFGKRFRIPEFIPLLPRQVSPVSDPKKTMVITDLGVVGDPTRTINPCVASNPTPNENDTLGVWTFGYLMKEMANKPLTGIEGEQFVRRWLHRFETTQVVNDWQLNPRDVSRILAAWQQFSGAGNPLRLKHAPFKLLAIVNRIDLRHKGVYGASDAGEGRFVFAALDQNCQPIKFLVILEYGIPRSGCSQVKAWASEWNQLDGMTPGTPAYNQKLEDITSQFAKAGSGGSRPNGSALNQLRTNEFLIGPWQLREFILAPSDSDAGHLRQATVKQTPDLSLDGSTAVASWVNANEAAVLANTHLVPLDFPVGSHFIGGVADVPSPAFQWNGTGITNASARGAFSLATCNGCHSGETGTFFTHVSETGVLSAFLQQDMQRRAEEMRDLIDSSCLFEFARPPLRMTH